MIVFQSAPSIHVPDKKIVLLFGLGLIGNEIFVNLIRHGYNYKSHDFDWVDRSKQEAQARELAIEVQGIIKSTVAVQPAAVDINIIWAAGKAGFSSLEDETLTEEISFRNVLEFYKKLTETHAFGRVVFHLLSSAGGLFESQNHITLRSSPSPRRAYGHLKLKLEDLLIECSDSASRNIYRPSSVYGPLNMGRTGIIPTLIKNGLLNKEVQILGSMDTLRDYVFSGDIGAYVTKKIISHKKEGGIHFLVSGKPTSLLQLKNTTERILNKKIYICSNLADSNAENITFDQSCRPSDWNPIELNLGIRKIHSDFFSKITA